ncbi:MAG: hypothetical protein DI498_03540 [Paracoccus denitrificans]|nr:MAG: hypothetical protein DI498_03540 [Paracoccus denitrificans]PZO85597.1 MAG: hypothetical protein DI633_03540 [Paracoccus denitrificans]
MRAMSNNPAIKLSIIIPVYNASKTLERLLGKITEIDDISYEVVLIDDASTDGSYDIISSAVDSDHRISAIYNKRNMGAGVSRNKGFALVRGQYTIFFDADDILHQEVISPALDIMDHDSKIDISIFKYSYTSSLAQKFRPMSYVDESIFVQVLKGCSSKVVEFQSYPSIARITNYPWNKIIRTESYRQYTQLFGKTFVHNDMIAHWQMLLVSRKIILLDHEICTHIVDNRGTNITNVSSGQRLGLFDALISTYELIKKYPSLKIRSVASYWDMAVTLYDWGREKVSSDLQDQFALQYRNLVSRMDIEDIRHLRASGHGYLADQIVSKYFSR